MKYLAPIPCQFVDNCGVPYSNGTVEAFASGTTTHAQLFNDSDGESIMENPVGLDSLGAWRGFVTGTDPIDYIVKDRNGNVVFQFEKVKVISGENDPAIAEVLADIAPEYDPSATYEEGELRTVGNTLYRCSVEGGILEPEEFTPAHWTVTDIASEINAMDEEMMNAIWNNTPPGN